MFHKHMYKVELSSYAILDRKYIFMQYVSKDLTTTLEYIYLKMIKHIILVIDCEFFYA